MVIAEFVVFGAPQPKGSARAFVPKGWTRPVITSTNKSLKMWEQVVRTAAQGHVSRVSHGAIALDVTFVLPRPKALGKTRTVAHMKRPDLDKLIRCADALSGVVFADDSQVVSITACKRYAGYAEPPHARIRVEEIA